MEARIPRPHPAASIIGLLVVLSGTATAESVGFRGHGNGVCRGSDAVPTGFSEERGVKWKVTLPSIGHASPIVIDDRVLVLCDGGHELQTPTLLCYHADSGEELWRAPVDVVDTLPTAIREEARRRRAAEWERLAGWGRECARVREAGDLKRWKDRSEPASVEAGYPVWLNNPPTRGLMGYHPSEKMGASAEQVANLAWLERHQVLFHDHWFYWYTKAFPTPVSDGEHVWVATGLDVVACYDLADGSRRWITRTYDSEDKWGSPDAIVNSPVLVDGTLVWTSEYSAEVLGLDAESGAIRWRTSLIRDPSKRTDKRGRLRGSGKAGLCTLVPVQVAGDWYVANSSGMLFRLADGEMVYRLGDPLGEATRSGEKELEGIATGAALGQRLFLPVSGSGGGTRKDTGVRAFDLRADGSLTGEAIWARLYGQTCGSIVAMDDLVFCWTKKSPSPAFKPTPTVLDADTGEVRTRAGKHAPRGGAFFGAVACAGHVVVTDATSPNRKGEGVHGARFDVYSLPELEHLGTGELQLATDGSEDDRWTDLWGGARRWGWAHPFIYENRLYIRSNEALYCIGK